MQLARRQGTTPVSRVTPRRSTAIAFALAALSGVVHGCSTPTQPAPPPAGGRSLDLNYDQFVAQVEPIIVHHGCDAVGDCHGGGIRGSLQLSPPSAKNPRYDFDQVALEVSAYTPDSSLILTKPLALAAGGTAHSVKPFAPTADSEYQVVRGWILAGVVR